MRDGSVYCWGGNFGGILGAPLTLENSAIPLRVDGLDRVERVALGLFHSCALTRRRTVACWGIEPWSGGVSARRPDAGPIDGLHDVDEITAGFRHTCARTRTGVYCWGWNDFGQLGNGTTTASSSPQPVVGLDEPVISISAGGSTTCAVLIGGRLRCWGANNAGQLGEHRGEESTRPVDIEFLAHLTPSVGPAIPN